MRNLKAKRWGAREVSSGKFKGGLHVATKAFHSYFEELLFIHDYLNRRVIPTDLEEVMMRGILLNLQNAIEFECDETIYAFSRKSGVSKYMAFAEGVKRGDVSFKAKSDWLKARGVIAPDSWAVLEEIRVLRNGHVHFRSAPGRLRFKYRGFPLMTARSLHNILLDCEIVLHRLRKHSGRASRWATIPPGYADELHWLSPLSSKAG